MKENKIHDIIFEDLVKKRQAKIPIPQIRSYEEAEEYAFQLIEEAEEGLDTDLLDHHSVSDFILKREIEVEYYDVLGVPVYEDEEYEYDDHIHTAIGLMQTHGKVRHPVFDALGSSVKSTFDVYEVDKLAIDFATERVKKMENYNV
jgi:hypothetical protein